MIRLISLLNPPCFEGKKFNYGKWKVGNMTGYTSRGAGVSGMPIRFNCPAEVTIINLFD
ncbi:MAG: hypothetical protein NTV01_05290 [Bacteroidia bacterium]|nr:hypothetical protein [Bacteroidia bacterium]